MLCCYYGAANSDGNCEQKYNAGKLIYLFALLSGCDNNAQTRATLLALFPKQCEVVTISPKQRKSLSEHRGSPLSLSSDSAVANLSDDEVVSEAESHSKLRRGSSGIWS